MMPLRQPTCNFWMAKFNFCARIRLHIAQPHVYALANVYGLTEIAVGFPHVEENANLVRLIPFSLQDTRTFVKRYLILAVSIINFNFSTTWSSVNKFVNTFFPTLSMPCLYNLVQHD